MAYQVLIVDERKRIPNEVIYDIARRVADQFYPQRIILFGSYAYGEPRQEIDLTC